jgi:glycosyltransferase involved in cell wall biosynthesis
MNILFLHQNFPGQFLHVAKALKAAGHNLVAIADQANTRPDLVTTIRYNFSSALSGTPLPLASYYNERVARGEIVAQSMFALKAAGFVPDVVLGHPGWGEMLFARDVWPKARILAHCEYYCKEDAADLSFDPEFAWSADPKHAMRIRINNAVQLQSLHDADFGLAPTQWQASLFPSPLQPKITVMHEGIDTGAITPDPNAVFETPDRSVRLRHGDEIVSFVSRNLEPYRGYHLFMRALPEILARRPNAHAVIIGGESVSYSPRPPKGQNWKDIYLNEVKADLPMDRVHFTGKIAYDRFIALMQATSVHVYPTYPFVLSWSMLEAMSAGALVLASDVAPVRELITDGHNGRLVDCLDRDALISGVVDALAHPRDYLPIRQAARITIQRDYDLATERLPQWLSFVEKLAGAQRGDVT